MFSHLCIEMLQGPFLRLKRTIGAFEAAFTTHFDEEEALSCLDERVQAIAKKAGLTHPIRAYSWEATGALAGRILLISPKDRERPEPELSFLLHHEIAGHMAHQDHLWELLFHIAYLIIDVASLYLCPPTIFLAEGFNFLINCAVWQEREKNADLAAVEAMGSPEGALAYFHSCLEESGEISGFTKHPPYEERIRYCSSSALPV